MLLLELFKGTGSIGKICKKLKINVISLDLEEKYKPDILTDILNWDYKKLNVIPDLIWASPPCNTFSPLAYPLKERNIKTAEPLSERALLGTKILYKTLEIIKYFKKKNPKLIFCIENPKGMMRQDKNIKKLMIATTTYCSYGDIKRKLTDFFTNFYLELLEPNLKCNKNLTPVVKLSLEDRYSIPSNLVKSILEQMIYKYYN
jgi:site-specific DNA-cytosine methylase